MTDEFDIAQEAELEVEAGAELEAEAEFEAEPEFEAGSEAEAELEVESEAEAEVESEIELETETAPAAIPTSFGTVTDRLSEIAEIMEDETMPLDDALDLLEEAVALGMQASSLLESDMSERDAEDEAADEEAEFEAEEAAGEASLTSEAMATAEEGQAGETAEL